jgi:predicted metalloprotease with PDZ domain
MRISTIYFSAVAGLAAMAGPSPSVAAQKPPIQITADLTDAPRKLYRAEIEIPVSPGPISLTTPQWIPGDHRPTGPVSDVVGVVFTANGQTLAWRRDDVDLYQFHLTIPAGVSTLHAHLDCIVTGRVSQKMAVLEWERLMLYPASTPVRDIAIEPSLKVPEGWGIGTALTPTGSGPYPVPAAGATTQFAVTNVEQLEDSPVITGRYFHEFPLAPNVSPKHYLDVVADSPEDAQLRPEVLAATSNLVREADALYQSHHYHVYHFLLTLSDVAGSEGLEHGQSSDNGVGEKGYADDDHTVGNSDLLPHEFTHSWNGKYRRPADLYQADFATAQRGSLLWVYEGMTQYLGNVLAARSGFETQAQYRDRLAMSAARLEYSPGRAWRSTEDTAIAASILRDRNAAWANLRRGQDYYPEGELLWLDADTLIRNLTGNRRSLNDFERIFLAKGGNTGPLIATYTFDELVADLNTVVAYDWATFLRDRVDQISSDADFAGIERGGYKLVFKDKPSATQLAMTRAHARRMMGPDCWFSIGLRVDENGSITDVRWNGPADKARLAPGEKIIAVDGQIYSADRLQEAIRTAKGNIEAIHLIVQADSFVNMAEIDYHEGERFPALERAEGTADLLDDITAPLTRPEKAPAEAKRDEPGR